MITSDLLKENNVTEFEIWWNLSLFCEEEGSNGTKINFAQSLLLLVQGMRIGGVMRV